MARSQWFGYPHTRGAPYTAWYIDGLLKRRWIALANIGVALLAYWSASSMFSHLPQLTMSWLLVGWPTQSTASARSAQSSVWPSVDQDEIYVALTKEVCPGICMSEEKVAAKNLEQWVGPRWGAFIKLVRPAGCRWIAPPIKLCPNKTLEPPLPSFGVRAVHI